MKRKPGLGRLQDLIGGMKNVYLNDRDMFLADKLIPMMNEAFEIIVRINSRRPPQKPRKGAKRK